MHKVLVTGAGKIGSLICCLLSESGQYQVCLADLDFSGADCARIKNLKNVELVKLDVSNDSEFSELCRAKKFDAVISSLPYFCNSHVAKMAKEFDMHYFDLTEDTSVTTAVKKVAENAKTAFVPQCGLAPGFITIAAHSLMSHFDEIDAVKMRVGALPVNSNNALQYSLTWSTDGLINEYGNSCYGIENGKDALLHPLEGLEHIQIDGMCYEAFNTSGGLGSLAELYRGKVNTMNYKTIRYPGHCDKMRLLMNDLKLNEDRQTLKLILERSVPKTYQDVVLVYVCVTGKQNGHLLEENYVNKVYPETIAGLRWSAIQVTTASGICTVMDIVLNNQKDYQGFVHQEKISLDHFLDNHFGQYYA